MTVHQLVPALHENDAIGETIVMFHRFLQDMNINARIWALSADPLVDVPVDDLSAFSDNPGDVTLLHYALPSPATQALLAAKGKKAMVFHNITPARFFKGIHPEFVHIANTGYEEVQYLRDQLDITICDSSYNRDILAGLGYENVHVFPVFINFSRLDGPVQRGVMRQLGDYLNILMLGRISPNKCQQDAMRAFNLIKLKYYLKSRLWFVGKYTDHPLYHRSLIRFASAWGLSDVIFTGKVPARELNTYLRGCTVLLILSEHEGFCVPVLEGFHCRTPVVAYNAGAVAETMGTGGILLAKKDYAALAELLIRLHKDQDLRDQVIAGQLERLKDFSLPAQETRARELATLLLQ